MSKDFYKKRVVSTDTLQLAMTHAMVWNADEQTFLLLELLDLGETDHRRWYSEVFDIERERETERDVRYFMIT